MNRTRLIRIPVLVTMTFLILLQGCVSNNVYRQKAERFTAKKDFDAAVKYYNKALSEKPDDLDLKLRLKDSRQKASVQHMQKAEKLLKEKYYRQAIEELQVSIAFYSGNRKAVALIDKAKRMKESGYYVDKGKQQITNGEYKNARKSFQKALELNENNREAKDALEKFKKLEHELPEYRLDLSSNAPISMKFKKTPILNVFEILSKLTGINFIFDRDIKDSKVSLFMTDVSFDKFLSVLLDTHFLKAKLINRKTMLIYPDTPNKAKEYDELYVKTFYLSYLPAKSAVAILAKILTSKNITSNDKLNTLTVRGPKKEVEMAGRILEANDRTPSEVVLNVEILEVQRSKEKDLGLSVSDTITFGISETSSGIEYDPDFGFSNLGSLRDISQLTDKELYLSLPTATLKLLKKDGDTKVLAKPQLRISSSEKASIHIGERVPIRTNRKVQTDGSTTYDFQYQDVGVKLTAEPVINMYEQITMKLNIEVSALGNNVGTSTDPQYSIKTRSANTVLTINDGDTVIIGGLIEDADRSTIQKIPLAGDIPGIGKLFSSENSEVSNTDILMSITPVIIRQQDMPQKDVAEFWSGTQNNISMKKPPEEEIKEETAFKEYPDQEYIRIMADNEFLPSDDYFSIHVYSFRNREKAKKEAGRLEELDYSTWIKSAEIEGKTFYRVFAGQYNSYMEAEEARLHMMEQEGIPKDVYIVDRIYVYGE